MGNQIDQKSGVLCGRYQGILSSILSGVFVVGYASAMKYLKDLNPAELSTYNGLFIALISLPIFIASMEKFPQLNAKNIILTVLIAVMSTVAVLFRAAAYQMLTIGDASAIIFSIPFFTAAFERIILKERFSWMKLISLLLALVGTFLTVKFPLVIGSKISGDNSYSHVDLKQHLLGCAYAFINVFSNSGVIIAKRFTRDIPTSLCNVVMGIGIIVLSTSVSPAYGGIHNQDCSTILNVSLVVMGVTVGASSYFQLQAVQTEDPTTVAITLRSTDIILSFVVQLVFFKDAADAYSISGALIIFSCGFVAPLERWMEGQEEGSRWRNSWLLK